MSEYPTEEQLARIKDWDVLKDGTKELIDYIESLWWMPDWGFKLYQGRDHIFKRSVMKLQLHTGGWSGNEDIIEALRENFFWFLYWQKSIRGGHYWFEIDMDKFKEHP